MGDCTIQTKFHGELTVPDNRCLTFRYPMLGFESLRRYTLLVFDIDRQLHILQSLDDPATAFIVTDPRTYYPDYTVPASALPRGFPGTPETRVIAVVLAPTSPKQEAWTANLRAPILIDRDTRTGGQWTLRDPLNFREPWPGLPPAAVV